MTAMLRSTKLNASIAEPAPENAPARRSLCKIFFLRKMADTGKSFAGIFFLQKRRLFICKIILLCYIKQSVRFSGVRQSDHPAEYGKPGDCKTGSLQVYLRSIKKENLWVL